VMPKLLPVLHSVVHLLGIGSPTARGTHGVDHLRTSCYCCADDDDKCQRVVFELLLELGFPFVGWEHWLSFGWRIVLQYRSCYLCGRSVKKQISGKGRSRLLPQIRHATRLLFLNIISSACTHLTCSCLHTPGIHL